VNARTPIEAWPPPVRPQGRPGYSGRHFATVSPPDDDPLRVAERLAARLDSERISVEARARIKAGEPYSSVLEWQERTLSKAGAERWARLSASFDDVIAALGGAVQAPAIKALLRQARRAAALSA